MPNFIVKTHKQNVVYSGFQIFILNKGLNSGKPQKEPFTNSFVIIFENQEDCENIYWIAYSLWKSNYWHKFLCGSVIPFLRLPNFKNNFNSKVSLMLSDYKNYQKQVNALRALEQKEEYLTKNLSLINELRKAIIYEYYIK